MTWTDLTVLLGAVLFAAGITAATRRVRSARTQPRSDPATPDTPQTAEGRHLPSDLAFQQLDVLRDEADPQTRVEGISAVARAYVFAHFGVVGDASSHSEMLDQLHGQLSPQHLDPLRRTLRMADHARHGRPATSHQLPDALELELRTFIHASLPNPTSG
jgi:hypothetical protein